MWLSLVFGRFTFLLDWFGGFKDSLVIIALVVLFVFFLFIGAFIPPEVMYFSNNSLSMVYDSGNSICFNNFVASCSLSGGSPSSSLVLSKLLDMESAM